MINDRNDGQRRKYRNQRCFKRRKFRHKHRKQVAVIVLSVMLCVTILLAGLKSNANNNLTEQDTTETAAESEGDGAGDTVAESVKNDSEETTNIVESVSESSQGALDGLKTQLEQCIAQEEGTWSIYVKDLSTDEAININNQQMYAASLIKLFVMESCYEHMEQIVEYDSAYSGSLEESSEKVNDLLESMITVSDNEAYNELVRMYSSSRSFTEGCLFIEDYLLTDTDYINTGIFHTLSPSSTETERTEDTKNYTCVEDCGALLESIYDGTCVSESASREMLDLLLQQSVTEKIPAGISEGIQVANKTGETEEVQHDAAIIFGENTDYILCVMSCDLSATGEAVSTIQDISGITYDWLNGLSME